MNDDNHRSAPVAPEHKQIADKRRIRFEMCGFDHIWQEQSARPVHSLTEECRVMRKRCLDLSGNLADGSCSGGGVSFDPL